MKKGVGCLIASIVFCLLAVFAVLCGVTVTGSGFLDMSNWAKGVFFGAAFLLLMMSWAAWRAYRKK